MVAQRGRLAASLPGEERGEGRGEGKRKGGGVHHADVLAPRARGRGRPALVRLWNRYSSMRHA